MTLSPTGIFYIYPFFFVNQAQNSSLVPSKISSSIVSDSPFKVLRTWIEIKREQERGGEGKKRERMNWISRKFFLYKVTFGLYVLEWWEQCLINLFFLVVLWFISYNGYRFTTYFFDSYLKSAFIRGGSPQSIRRIS